MNVHTHGMRRHEFKSNGVRPGGEDSLSAQPACTLDSRAGTMKLRLEACSVFKEAGPSRPQQYNVATRNAHAVGSCCGFHVDGSDLEIRRQCFHVLLADDIEQNATAHDGSDRIYRVPLDPAAERLHLRNVHVAIKLSAAGKVAERVHVRTQVAAERQGVRS